MKQWKLFVAALLAAMCLLACAAADVLTVYTSGDSKYILLEDGTAEIADYTGTAETLDVPEMLDGYRVTSIGDQAFSFCSAQLVITVPQGSYAEPCCIDNGHHYTYSDAGEGRLN